MSGFDQSSIAVSMPTVVGADAALGGPYKIKPSEAFSGALMTVSGLTGETISVETSPDGYWGAPASPSFYRTDWQGTSLLYPTARTNYFLGSTSFAYCTPTNMSLTTGIDDPSGGTNAVTLTASAANGTYSQSGGINTIPAGTYCSSVWVRRRTGTGTVQMRAPDLTNKNLTVTDHWTRVSYSGVQGAIDNTGFIIRVVTSGDAVDIAFAQCELGTIATPYIPTTTTAVTITDYTLSNGVITLAQAPITGATLSYDNSVLPSPYYIFATGDGVRTQFAYDGVWGTLSANSGKGNGIWQVDLRGAQAYRLVKSAGSETATVNMTLKRDALQYTNSAGTWSVT